jgi:hypothetical protein
VWLIGILCGLFAVDMYDHVQGGLNANFLYFPTSSRSVVEKQRREEMRTLQLQCDTELPERVEALLREEIDDGVRARLGVGAPRDPLGLLAANDSLLAQVVQHVRRLQLPGQRVLVTLQQPGDAPGAGHGGGHLWTFTSLGFNQH